MISVNFHIEEERAVLQYAGLTIIVPNPHTLDATNRLSQFQITVVGKFKQYSLTHLVINSLVQLAVGLAHINQGLDKQGDFQWTREDYEEGMLSLGCPAPDIQGLLPEVTRKFECIVDSQDGCDLPITRDGGSLDAPELPVVLENFIAKYYRQGHFTNAQQQRLALHEIGFKVRMISQEEWEAELEYAREAKENPNEENQS